LVSVDAGARKALERGGTSLLAAVVVGVSGEFDVDDAVEIADESGEVFAKGLVRMSSTTLTDASGHSRSELPVEVPAQVVHADDLVILP
jgi:glutamate 5-kinase